MLEQAMHPFFLTGEIPSHAVSGTYMWPVVVLSYLVAVMASYAALDFGGYVFRHRDKPSTRRLLMHGAGALAMGNGIWSMHFIGMLAYRMDMTVRYDPVLTFLFMVVAVLVAYAVIGNVRSSNLGWKALAVNSSLMGVGIIVL